MEDDVRLPAAVQKNLNIADEYVRALTGTDGKPRVVHEGEPSTPQQPVEPVADATPPPQPVVPQAPVVTEDWEQKFKSLNGKYNAEVPALHAQNRELTSKLTQLVQTVETMRTELTAAKAPPAAPVAPPTPLVTDKDRNEFGPELVDLMERVVAGKTAVLEADNAALRKSLDEINGQVGQVGKHVQGTALETFNRRLTELIGADWEAQNFDEKFIEWTKVVDPLYGISKSVVLKQAATNFDAARVASIFNAYRAESTPPADNQAELQRQVAPTRSRGAPAPSAQPAQTIWTNEMVNAHYDKLLKNQYTSEEATRLEADLHAAMSEGRVRM